MTNGNGTALATREQTALASASDNFDWSMMEQVFIKGDLASLSPQQRVEYYRTVCDSLGLNPFTRPFEYITLNSKLILYAKKDATDQVRKRHGVSIVKTETQVADGLCIVTVQARTPDGREDSEIGVVNIANLSGEAKANALMKALTKAKRRVTLAICGLGMLDETEVETVPSAQPTVVDHATGEISRPASTLDSELRRIYGGDAEKKTALSVALTGSDIAQLDPEARTKLLARLIDIADAAEADGLVELSRQRAGAKRELKRIFPTNRDKDNDLIRALTQGVEWKDLDLAGMQKLKAALGNVSGESEADKIIYAVQPEEADFLEEVAGEPPF